MRLFGVAALLCAAIVGEAEAADHPFQILPVSHNNTGGPITVFEALYFDYRAHTVKSCSANYTDSNVIHNELKGPFCRVLNLKGTDPTQIDGPAHSIGEASHAKSAHGFWKVDQSTGAITICVVSTNPTMPCNTGY
jgi:hypothetical protein